MSDDELLNCSDVSELSINHLIFRMIRKIVDRFLLFSLQRECDFKWQHSYRNNGKKFNMAAQIEL